MSLPSTMKAITISDNKATVAERSLPRPRSTYLLAKVEAIALNPTDWKHIASKRAGKGTTSGCDFAGTVVKVGEGVTKSFKPGDRIAGCAHGANYSEKEDGVFAEYAMVKGDLMMKIPDSMSFEEACTFPLGVATVGQGLFQKALQMDLPDPAATVKNHGEHVLIYGGSTATGALGIQFAKLAGYTVLTTCGKHNFDQAKKLGAEMVFDYREEDCGAKIREATGDKLKLCWDTISLEASAKICAEALSSDPQGCRYGSILPVKFPREEVQTKGTLMYTIFNETFEKGGRETPASPEDFEFAKKMFAVTEQFFQEGKLKTHPEKVGKDGLAGALEGMKEMQKDKVSGQKLVYRVAETPAAGASAEF